MLHPVRTPASIVVLATAMVLATAVFLLPASASAEVNVGDRAAEFVGAKDAKGRRVKLKSYRKKIVVVTFGASWCKPCKKELPAWDKLAAEYKDVVFLAVNIDKNLAKGKKFIAQAELGTMRPVYDPKGSSAATYEPPTMPSTYVIGPRGVVRHRHAGYRKGDEKALAKVLDKLIAN